MSGLVGSSVRVQRGWVNLNAGVASNTAAVNSVVMSRAVLNVVGIDAPAAAGTPGVMLSSPVQVFVSRTDTTGAITVYFELMDS